MPRTQVKEVKRPVETVERKHRKTLNELYGYLGRLEEAWIEDGDPNPKVRDPEMMMRLLNFLPHYRKLITEALSVYHSG